jgi:hypothetical protein
MRQASVVAFATLLLICAYSTAAPKKEPKEKETVDVTGTWKVEVDLGGNTGNPEFSLKQKDDEVTGKYKGQFGEADVKGKVTGKKIEFSFSVGDMGKAVYSGTVEEDTMKGTVKYGDQLSGTFTGKRSKEKEAK